LSPMTKIIVGIKISGLHVGMDEGTIRCYEKKLSDHKKEERR
jgi:hypothetical protein